MWRYINQLLKIHWDESSLPIFFDVELRCWHSSLSLYHPSNAWASQHSSLSRQFFEYWMKIYDRSFAEIILSKGNICANLDCIQNLEFYIHRNRLSIWFHFWEDETKITTKHETWKTFCTPVMNKNIKSKHRLGLVEHSHHKFNSAWYSGFISICPFTASLGP